MMLVEVPGMYQPHSWLSVNISVLSSSFQELLRERKSPALLTQWLGSPLRAELCHRLLHSPMVVPTAVPLASPCLR